MKEFKNYLRRNIVKTGLGAVAIAGISTLV